MLELLLFPVEKPAATPLIEVVKETKVELVEEKSDDDKNKQQSRKNVATEPVQTGPTVAEKVAQNYYDCDEEKQYVRADNAECIDKPQAAQPQQTSRAVTTVSQQRSQTVATAPARSSSPGNTYTRGQCTWHVKNLKPSIPNGWGNAGNWINAARSSGWTVSSRPVVGAVGARGNHVVYVKAVNGNTVTVTEMNYLSIPYNINVGSYPVGYFTYIY